ncbi:MAG: hypothetical protein ACP5J4_13915 [Anaerolineae bacterium]
MMKKLFTLRPFALLGVYTFLNIICIGMGMGVPFFCILFGLPVGWYIVKRLTAEQAEMRDIFRKVLLFAAIAAAVTFLGMLLIWGPLTVKSLSDPTTDFVETGVPMILYEPKASFIGWIVLMVIISPGLQLLTTIFASHLTLLAWLNEEDRTSMS